nr:hypothetical protein [Morchella crassipes]
MIKRYLINSASNVDEAKHFLMSFRYDINHIDQNDVVKMAHRYVNCAKFGEKLLQDKIRELVLEKMKALRLESKNKDLLVEITNKNQQIEQLKREITKLENTIALLEEEPDNFIEAQSLLIPQKNYPEYFAELEEIVSEEKAIWISDFIRLLDGKIADITGQLIALQTAKDETDANLAQANTNLMNVQQDLAIVNADKDILTGQIDTLTTERDDLNQQVANKDRAITTLTGEKNTLTSQLQAKEISLTAANANLTIETAKLAAEQNKLADEQQRHLITKADLMTATAILTAEKGKVATLTNDLVAVNLQNSQLGKKNSRLLRQIEKRPYSPSL